MDCLYIYIHKGLQTKPQRSKIGSPDYLDAQLGTSPVASLGVVGNSVTSSESLPVRNRLVVVLLLGKSSLGSECLMGWLLKRDEDKYKEYIKVSSCVNKYRREYISYLIE